MKALVLVTATLALFSLLPALAQAQGSSALTVQLMPPEAALIDGSSITITGNVTLTADLLAYANLNGIPVTYTVEKQPAWLVVSVTPSSDVFPLPQTPTGTAISITRPISVTLSPDPASAPSMDTVSKVILGATAIPSAPASWSVQGRGSIPIMYDAPDPVPCAEHEGMTHEQMAQMAVDAANAYNAQQRDEASGDDVTVQNAAATTLPMPWVAVAGFALVGAAAGLVLRRRRA